HPQHHPNPPTPAPTTPPHPRPPQGHISAGVIGSNTSYEVNLLTRHPQLWSHQFKTIDLQGKEFNANLNIITDNPAEVIPYCDIILVTLPGFAIKENLAKIAPYLSHNAIVGCVFGGSGFFIAAQQEIGPAVRAFALQRVPFTGRPIEYGHSGRLKGYKPYLKVATLNLNETETDKIVDMLVDWYDTPVYKLSHWLEATLSNSNPLLHPCRMYTMFKDWTPEKIYDRIPFMYNTDWDDESSQCWVDCDNELRRVMEQLPMNVDEVPSVLDYYGCNDIPSLTTKMQNIEPFKTVQAHMIETSQGYKVDTSVRYFTEDIPFGLLLIKAFAEKVNVPTPNIDKVIMWAQNLMNKEYLVDGRLTGKDIDEGYNSDNISI
ncbi:MAG: NAD/NADP octopine/nopaline dehydrogenase family protein, partial [Muribaculaceae bacterium]|nr:NAD/NADP octopine/nopaline dehydrogenase family protein [Muribaculaceae bacterium]